MLLKSKLKEDLGLKTESLEDLLQQEIQHGPDEVIVELNGRIDYINGELERCH